MLSCVFGCVAIGLLLGKLRVVHARIGLSGVLLVSLVFGYLSSKIPELNSMLTGSVCDYLTTFGTALFISVVGIQTGEIILKVRGKHLLKAFLGGAMVVAVGALLIVLVGIWDDEVPSDYLLGIFSGSMTSTPAMSAGIDAYGAESLVSIGYGLSYCVGLISVVMFVQLIRLPVWRNRVETDSADATGSCTEKKEQPSILLPIAITITIGSSLTRLLPIGNTGCILLSGIIIGVARFMTKHPFADMNSIKTFGLIMFFIGAGVTAGQSFNGVIYWRGFLYGAAVSWLTISLGYLLMRYALRFNVKDSLTILCGGMTSTPAIGTLQERSHDIDMSLYSSSYIGALLFIVSFVKMIGWIWQ